MAQGPRLLPRRFSSGALKVPAHPIRREMIPSKTQGPPDAGSDYQACTWSVRAGSCAPKKYSTAVLRGSCGNHTCVGTYINSPTLNSKTPCGPNKPRCSQGSKSLSASGSVQMAAGAANSHLILGACRLCTFLEGTSVGPKYPRYIAKSSFMSDSIDGIECIAYCVLYVVCCLLLLRL